MQHMEEAFAAAAAMGVTVTVAAGDNGSGDAVTDGLAHVDFPASAPHALACGGTRPAMAGGRIAAETVWDDGRPGGAGGGGISVVFPVPAYQLEAQVPVSANPEADAAGACPISAAMPTPIPAMPSRVNGQAMTVGGTSAVAPLWAGAHRPVRPVLGPVRRCFIHPFLYSAAARAGLHDITAGAQRGLFRRAGLGRLHRTGPRRQRLAGRLTAASAPGASA